MGRGQNFGWRRAIGVGTIYVGPTSRSKGLERTAHVRAVRLPPASRSRCCNLAGDGQQALLSTCLMTNSEEIR